jgi:hypothetical protein
MHEPENNKKNKSASSHQTASSQPSPRLPSHSPTKQRARWLLSSLPFSSSPSAACPAPSSRPTHVRAELGRSRRRSRAGRCMPVRSGPFMKDPSLQSAPPGTPSGGVSLSVMGLGDFRFWCTFVTPPSPPLLPSAVRSVAQPSATTTRMSLSPVDVFAQIPVEQQDKLLEVSNSFMTLASKESDFGGYTGPIVGLGLIAALVLVLSPPLAD